MNKMFDYVTTLSSMKLCQLLSEIPFNNIVKVLLVMVKIDDPQTHCIQVNILEFS